MIIELPFDWIQILSFALLVCVSLIMKRNSSPSQPPIVKKGSLSKIIVQQMVWENSFSKGIITKQSLGQNNAKRASFIKWKSPIQTVSWAARWWLNLLPQKQKWLSMFVVTPRENHILISEILLNQISRNDSQNMFAHRNQFSNLPMTRQRLTLGVISFRPK